MVCPFCGRVKTSVRNTRQSNRRGQVWRRRSCEKCRRTFTTRESIELGFLEVLKRSGLKESYSRSKLLRSLIFATDHLDDADVAFALADTIETNLLSSLSEAETNNSVPTQTISDQTQLVLQRFDTRAYVKYISYQTKSLDASDLRKRLLTRRS